MSSMYIATFYFLVISIIMIFFFLFFGQVKIDGDQNIIHKYLDKTSSVSRVGLLFQLVSLICLQTFNYEQKFVFGHAETRLTKITRFRKVCMYRRKVYDLLTQSKKWARNLMPDPTVFFLTPIFGNTVLHMDFGFSYIYIAADRCIQQ